jgi:hypothetical protein
MPTDLYSKIERRVPFNVGKDGNQANKLKVRTRASEAISCIDVVLPRFMMPYTRAPMRENCVHNAEIGMIRYESTTGHEHFNRVTLLTQLPIMVLATGI